MKRLQIVIALVLSCVCLLGCDQPRLSVRQPVTDAKPNIIFFYIDDLGWNDVGFNGSTYYETPNIDELATQGIIFSNAYANAPNCAPSRASLLTGMYTPRHKIYTVGESARGKDENRRMIPVKNTDALALEYVTLTEALKGAGYTTGHFGKWHLGGEGYFPEDQGFDVNAGGHHRGSPPGGHFSPYKNPKLADGPDGEYLTDRLTDEALAFIDESQDQPFFLYLSHYAVHTPLQGKDELKSKYEAKKNEGGQNNATYAAMIESVDESVGRILAEVESRGISDNTMVVFYSDNGGAIQATSNHPLRGYKGMMYEGGIRVPLAIKWPAVIEASRISDTPVIGVDFYPTFTDLIGFSEPHQVDGESLWPVLSNEGSIKSRDLFWHFPAYLQKAGRMTDPRRTTPVGCIRSGDYKLIEFFEDGRLELYNLAEDLSETTNLASLMPEKAAELHAKLIDWREEIGADMPVHK